jgi:O-antigen chain-terminating methyltransferase
MQYYLEKAGFKDIEIIFTESSRPPVAIPALKCDSAENTAEFNAAMKQVSDMIFGSQDYAVVAVKKG